MVTKKKKAAKFNFGVGFYWEGESGNVGLYTQGGEIYYGTMKDANNFLKYVKSQQQDEADRMKYKIFMLVEVPH